MTRFLEIIKGMGNTKVVTNDDRYARIEFTSNLFRFVDDVELYIDETTNTVQLRSASRVGYYDFGTNRKRMLKIRNQMMKGKLVTL